MLHRGFMHGRAKPSTLHFVHAFRSLGVGGFLWVVLCGGVPTAAAARVATTTINVDAPIVRVTLEQADVTIKTWSRSEVQIEGDAGTFNVRREVKRVPDSLPPAPIAPAVTQGPAGTTITLPAESFVIGSVRPGPHQFVEINPPASNAPEAAFAAFAGPLTVTVPSNSILVAAHLVTGSIVIQGYHGGTYLATLRSGDVALDDVGGDGFVQVLRGSLSVTDSHLNRLRARTALGDMIFRNCHSRQIQATSVDGSIVYDGGSFEAGLAQFESSHGDVAVGSTSASQLNGRVSSGKIYTAFDRDARVENGPFAVKATLDGGGPVINAASTAGDVFLYDGSIRSHRRLGPAWRIPRRIANGRPPARSPFDRFRSDLTPRTRRAARYMRKTPKRVVFTGP